MSVNDIFVGKKVFITGGTGFLGKVLIEKLLRNCPGVEKIYVLIRPRRGKSAQERLEEIKELPLFDKARELDPGCMTKVVAIAGDVTKLKIGMSDEDWNFIADNVNIIYSTAASVRFDDFLKYAILMNVRGTREIATLALQAKNLTVFSHISTTYCNTDKKVIEEKIYPAHTDWRMAIKLAEEADDELMETLTMKYIDPLPNTYTFTKSLAEHVINDMCRGKIPAFILRPSVVISIIEDPLRGWIDNLNGPVGLLVAGGKGILRTIWGHPECVQDYIPVDLVIRTIILATRQKILNGHNDDVEVYNCSKYDRRPISIGKIVEMGRDLIWDSPFSQVLWYPRFSITTCWYSFYIQVLLFHMLPAMFLDLIMGITGKKKMFVKIHRKIYIANVVLEYFIRNAWEFKHDRAINLDETISKEDYDNFTLTKFIAMNEKQMYNFFRSSKILVMTFMFKEKFAQEKSRKMIWRLWLLDIIVWSMIYCLIAWFLILKLDIINVINNHVYNYFANLPV